MEFSSAFRDSYKGQTAYIVGKGPSLNNITEFWFKEPGPVFAINESIKHFEGIDYRKNVYSLQQDGKPECMVRPLWAPLLLSQQSDTWFPNYPLRFTYNQVRDLGIMDKMITAISAIEIARIMGCTKLVFAAFDSCTVGDADYPKWVRYRDPANSLKRFRRFYDIIRLNLRGSSATFLDPLGEEHHTLQSGEFTVITLTGDRHVPFKLCKEWILRQTLLPGQWLVVDDGKRPLRWGQWAGADYHRRRPNGRDPDHTIKLNMLEALKHIKYNRVIIMEDDDWYAPEHCETLYNLLDEYELVGQTNAYMCYWPMSLMVHLWTEKHAGYFKTGFRESMYEIVENICRKIRGPLIDMALWKQPLGTRHLVDEKQHRPLSIGMKGLTGRKGQTSGWKFNREGYTFDKDNKKLRSLMEPGDVEIYKQHFAQIQRAPMNYEQREDELYSWLWEKGSYADGEGAAPRMRKFVLWAQQVTDLENQSILDLGCGKAELATMLPYKKYMGVDISTYQTEQNILKLGSEKAQFLHHSIDRLPFNDMSYDLAICQDVMEHIPEDRVDRVLKEMFRVASAIILVIDCREARLMGPNGEQLHCTIKEHRWWMDRIRKLGVVRYEEYDDFKLTVYCGSAYKSQGVFPEILYGVRLRRHPDGSVWIPRANAKVEREMDAKYQRVDRQLRWHYCIADPVSIKQLEKRYQGKTCYIVGKGPSLDNADASIFEAGNPIICLNESVHKIEATDVPDVDLFMMQQDTGINCRPKRAMPLMHFFIKHLYPEINQRYVFSDTDFGRAKHSLTVLVAIAAAKYMGCKKVVLVAFDACVNGKTGYAECIGHQPCKTNSGGQDRFLTHRPLIEKEATGLEIEWVLPARSVSVS